MCVLQRNATVCVYHNLLSTHCDSHTTLFQESSRQCSTTSAQYPNTTPSSKSDCHSHCQPTGNRHCQPTRNKQSVDIRLLLHTMTIITHHVKLEICRA